MYRVKNHSAKCCPPDIRRKTHGVTGEHPQSSHTDDYEDDCILSVETEAMHSVLTHPTGPLYTEMLLPDGKPLQMQIDSGATVNVLPAKHVGSAKLMHSDVQLRMYNKAAVKPLGKCCLHLVNPVNNHKHAVVCQVVEENHTPLLSRKAAERMNLITVNFANFKQLYVVGRANCDAITDEFKTVFEGASIGVCLALSVILKTEDGARPVQCPPQRVSIALQSKLNEELDDLVKSKVITPVTEPTEWCSQIAKQTKKNGKLRVCIDPRPLNEALRREKYPLPTIEDVLPELSHAKVFSKVDLLHCYWHCKLDDTTMLITEEYTLQQVSFWALTVTTTFVSTEPWVGLPLDSDHRFFVSKLAPGHSDVQTVLS